MIFGCPSNDGLGFSLRNIARHAASGLVPGGHVASFAQRAMRRGRPHRLTPMQMRARARHRYYR